MLDKLGDDFIIADVEYTSEFEGEERYSVTIIGAFGSGKVIDLDEEDTQNIDDITVPDDPPVNPDQPDPENPDNPNPDNPNPDNPNPDQPQEENKDDEQDERLAELQASFDAYREETQSKLDSLMEQLQAIQALLQQQQGN